MSQNADETRRFGDCDPPLIVLGHPNDRRDEIVRRDADDRTPARAARPEARRSDCRLTIAALTQVAAGRHRRSVLPAAHEAARRFISRDLRAGY